MCNRMLKAISLFSGCGGDTLGLTNADFEVVAFSEFNKYAIQSHLANFQSSVLLQALPEEKPKKGVRSTFDPTNIVNIQNSVFEVYKNKIDLIFAGFNCQGFSRAGKRDTDDPRNQMYLQFVRATSCIRPLYIIGENVTGLLSMKSGPDNDDPLMIELICKAFDEIGYTLMYRQLEATDFGVPQKRKRILLVGYDRARIPSIDSTLFWAKVHEQGTKNSVISQTTFVTNSMEGASLISKDAIPEGFADYAFAINQDIEPTGKSHPYVNLKIGENLLSCKKRDSPIHSEIIDVTSPSKTIICTYDHQPRLLVGLLKPDGTAYARPLLPEELKQIQGFPSNYVLCGAPKNHIVQIGNAVPPPMIMTLAKVLSTHLPTHLPKKVIKLRIKR